MNYRARFAKPEEFHRVAAKVIEETRQLAIKLANEKLD